MPTDAARTDDGGRLETVKAVSGGSKERPGACRLLQDSSRSSTSRGERTVGICLFDLVSPVRSEECPHDLVIRKPAMPSSLRGPRHDGGAGTTPLVSHLVYVTREVRDGGCWIAAVQCRPARFCGMHGILPVWRTPACNRVDGVPIPGEREHRHRSGGLARVWIGTARVASQRVACAKSDHRRDCGNAERSDTAEPRRHSSAPRDARDIHTAWIGNAAFDQGVEHRVEISYVIPVRCTRQFAGGVGHARYVPGETAGELDATIRHDDDKPMLISGSF